MTSQEITKKPEISVIPASTSGSRLKQVIKLEALDVAAKIAQGQVLRVERAATKSKNEWGAWLEKAHKMHANTALERMRVAALCSTRGVDHEGRNWTELRELAQGIDPMEGVEDIPRPEPPKPKAKAREPLTNEYRESRQAIRIEEQENLDKMAEYDALQGKRADQEAKALERSFENNIHPDTPAGNAARKAEKLLAKAVSTTSEAEASAFTAKAIELVREHGLDIMIVVPS